MKTHNFVIFNVYVTKYKDHEIQLYFSTSGLASLWRINKNWLAKHQQMVVSLDFSVAFFMGVHREHCIT